MKLKTIGISMALMICSVLLAWYALGELYPASDDQVGLVSPANATFTSNITVIFNCTAATNLSTGVKNITLWLTKSGGAMAYNRTNTSALSGLDIKNVSAMFNQFNLSEGLWFWNCRGFNGTSSIVNSSATDGVVIIDITAPSISLNTSATVYTNNSYLNPNTTSHMITVAVDISELWPTNLSYRLFMANDTSLLLTNFTNRSSTGANTHNLTLTSILFNISDLNLTGGVGVLNNTLDNAVLVVEVNVTDKVNQQTMLRRTLTIDSINPALSITAPFNGTTWKANATSLAIRFNISHSDTNLNASRAIYRFGAATGLSNTSFTQNTSELVNTSQTITFSMNATNQYGVNNTIIHFITKDKAGRETVNYTRINLDFAPVIALSYPTSGIWATTGANHRFNFTAINNDTTTSTLDSCTLYGTLAGSSYTANKTLNSSIANSGEANMGSYNGTTVPVNITLSLVEGNYTWAVWCNDTTGNSVYTANRTFYVDLTNPVPKVTAAESTGASTIHIADTVTLTCSATDTLDTAPSASLSQLTKPSGTVVTSPSASYTGTDETGTYTVKCSSTDVSGRTATTSTTFVVEYASQGGVTTNGVAAAAPVKTQTVTIPDIQPGSPNTVALADPQEYALKQIVIDVVNAVADVKITVKKMTSKPADAIEEAAETAAKVYRYIEVVKENLKDADIKTASIEFQVAKSWLTDQGAEKEQVTLKRLKGAGWETLKTAIVDEDDDNVHYKSSAPGLSYFAVAMEESPVVVTEEELAEAEAVIAEEAGAEALEEEAPPSKKGLWITLVVLLVVLAAAGAAILYFKKKR